MPRKRKGDKRKRRPSVRLPVAPPSKTHEVRTKYRRGREKERLRKEEEEGGGTPS